MGSRIGQQAPYLDGIPVVSSTALRNVLFPSAIDTNQRVQNLETGYVERWTGTFWASDIQALNAGTSVNIRAFGALGDGTTDDSPAIQAAIDAVKAAGGGVVYLPKGNYRINTPLSLANLGSTQIALVGDAHGEGTYNTTPLTGANLYGRTGTQAVIETQGSHFVTLCDFGIYSLLADSDRSAIGIFQGRTTFQASCQYHNYNRVFVTLANKTGANATRGSIAIYNVQAEHGLFDHLQLVADTPFVGHDNNALAYVPTFGTLTSVLSCALNTYRQCAFIALSNSAMELRGLLSTNFSDCYWGAFVTLPVAVQITDAPNAASRILFSGQCETYDSFVQIGDPETHDLTFDITWASNSSTGPLILLNVSNNILTYGLTARFWNTNAVVMDLIGVGGAAGCKMLGGYLILENGIKLNAPTLLLSGVTVRDDNATAQLVSLLATSDYQLLSQAILGMSADRGDANVTLQAHQDRQTQRFATNLTVNRTVTLSATGAYKGAKFRVVRTGLGAFTLDVGGLKTIPNSTAAFVDVEHDGTAWRLAAFGAL